MKNKSRIKRLQDMRLFELSAPKTSGIIKTCALSFFCLLQGIANATGVPVSTYETANVVQQNNTVKGKVVDTKGEPVIYVPQS